LQSLSQTAEAEVPKVCALVVTLSRNEKIKVITLDKDIGFIEIGS
jgi:hypothetical protein